MRFTANSLWARLLIGSAIPLVLFVGVGVVVAVMMTRLMTALRMEKHTLVVIRRAHQLHDDLAAMRSAVEAGSAGAREHPRFRSGEANFRRTVNALLELVDDNPHQQQSLQRCLAHLNQLQRLAQTGKPDLGRQARKVLGDIETDVRAFIENEENRLSDRHRLVDEETRQALPVIGGAAGLALVLTLLLSLTAAWSVTRPVARLREAAQHLLAGRYQSIRPSGPSELAHLIVAFNHMALTLTRRADVLERQEERYRTYIGALAHILWTTDPAGQVTADLPSWRAYTGQTEDDIRGEGWLDAVHPGDSDRIRQAWKAAVAQRSAYDVECRLRSANGEYRHFHCLGVPIINADGSVREWVGTCTDITESRQRAALEQAKEAAEAANRAKSEFLTRMSHELRTPLNAVIGMSKMLQTQRFGPLNDKQSDYLADITRAGEHLLALINDILDLSRVEAGKMEVHSDQFSLGEAVESLVSTLRPLAASKALAIQLEPSAEDGTLETDPARFRQVLYNLLSNAIKFTPAGQVGVKWEWVAGAHLDAPTAPQAQAEAVRVAVRDTGVGIAPEDQKVIWDEFRQVRPHEVTDQPGTGLGLALTRRLVTLLGGTIGLSSTVGQGSTFTFVLPRRLPTKEGADSQAQPEGNRPVALVIEDHGPTSKLLCDWLAGAGLSSVPALDGEAGLIAAHRLLPALIILDLRLPRLDGWQVLTGLKSDPATAAIPVVVVTVDEPLRPASNAAVLEFFLKPVEREPFLRRVRDRLPGLFRFGRPPRALVVDDDPLARKLLSDVLHGEGVEVHEADNGARALELIRQINPDVLLLDLAMPEVDGFNVIEQVRGACGLAGLPIIVVTARDLDEHDRDRLRGRIQALLEKHALSAERLREQLRALGVLPVPAPTQPA
jgi:PAS domain S-box-containing protein